MLLKVKSDISLADGRKFISGDVIDVSVMEARMLLQKHSHSLEAVYKDKAKHAPRGDKFSRKTSSISVK